MTLRCESQNEIHVRVSRGQKICVSWDWPVNTTKMAYSAISSFDIDEKFVDRSNLVTFFTNMDLWISRSVKLFCATYFYLLTQ
jgi:hypothetical protein